MGHTLKYLLPCYKVSLVEKKTVRTYEFVHLSGKERQKEKIQIQRRFMIVRNYLRPHFVRRLRPIAVSLSVYYYIVVVGTIVRKFIVRVLVCDFNKHIIIEKFSDLVSKYAIYCDKDGGR